MSVFLEFMNSFGGRIVSAVVVLILMASLAGFFYKKSFSIKQMSYAAMAITLAVILSYIKFSLPQGGSVTLCSMLFITLIGFWFGPSAGVIGGITYGFLQLAIEPFVVHPVQMILDYPIAFGMLGMSGFFRNRKHGLYIGFVVAAILRGVCSVLSGVVFFGEYAGDTNVWIYSIGYNMSYISVEIVLTCILISIPTFKRAIMLY